MKNFSKQIFIGLFLVLIGAQGTVLLSISLEENSPFIPFDYAESLPPPPTAPQKAPIELRGILDFNDELKFSFYNPSTQKSVWVKFNDKTAPYFVETYDTGKRIATVVVNGIPQRLELSKSSDVPVKTSSTTTAKPSVNEPISTQPRKAPEPLVDEADDEEEDTDEPEPEEDPEVKKRREMSEKVYEAFKKYVAEKKARAAAGE